MHRNVVRPRRGVRLPVSAAAAAWSGLVAGPVLAQENPAPTAPEVAQTEGLEEIIVTAQRRSEDLQEVPISVSAVTADTLRNTGIDATKDLPQLVPSVQVTRSGPSGLFFIRGVGTSNAAAGEEGANAFYVDGVYLGDLAQTINNFNNIERVEVLKGPQGTLFGRNATGGLIHVITREPGMDRVVNGQVGYANYDTLSGQLYAATPLSETLSADIALTASKQNEGWGENVTLGTDNKVSEFYGLRSKWVLRASEGLKFTLSGDYNESEDNLGLGWRIADGTIGTGGFSSPGGNDTSANRAALTKLEIWGASLTVEADLGFADLTSISAIRDNHNDSGFDVDGGPLNLINIDYISTSRTYQQELRLASTTVDPFSWQAGVFYLRSEAATAQTQCGDVFAGNGLQGLFGPAGPVRRRQPRYRFLCGIRRGQLCPARYHHLDCRTSLHQRPSRFHRASGSDSARWNGDHDAGHRRHPQIQRSHLACRTEAGPQRRRERLRVLQPRLQGRLLQSAESHRAARRSAVHRRL